MNVFIFYTFKFSWFSNSYTIRVYLYRCIVFEEEKMNKCVSKFVIYADCDLK